VSFNASTVPAFRAALKKGLEARAGLGGVSVCDGPAPPADLDRDELIELLDVVGEQSVHSLNKTTQPRRELMTLTLLITVVHATRDKQTEVNERAFVLLDELNQLLRDSDTGLTSIYAGPGRIYGPRVTSMTHTTRTNADNTRREAGLSVGVHWEGKI
jgi:hypothetical protein